MVKASKPRVYSGCGELFKTDAGMTKHLKPASTCFKKLIAMKTTRALKTTTILNESLQSNYDTEIIIQNNNNMDIDYEEENINNAEDNLVSMPEEDMEKIAGKNQSKPNRKLPGYME